MDVRDAMEFEGGHLAGALNVGLQGKYATWAGSILDREKPIVVIAETGKEEEAIMRLGRIGFDNVLGYLKDGMNALSNHPQLVHTIQRVTPRALSEMLSSADAPVVLDVRSEKEWQAGHLAGSLNLPLNHLRARMGEIPPGKPLAIHCQGGYRSAIAASLLSAEGREQLLDVVGGMKAWLASGLPSTQETSA